MGVLRSQVLIGADTVISKRPARVRKAAPPLWSPGVCPSKPRGLAALAGGVQQDIWHGSVCVVHVELFEQLSETHSRSQICLSWDLCPQLHSMPMGYQRGTQRALGDGLGSSFPAQGRATEEANPSDKGFALTESHLCMLWFEKTSLLVCIYDNTHKTTIGSVAATCQLFNQELNS